MGANIETDEAVFVHVKQGRCSKQEIEAEDILTSSLNLTGEACGGSMGKETAENGSSRNIACERDMENGSHEPLGESNGVHSVAVVAGNSGDHAAVSNLTLLDTAIHQEVHMPCSLDGGVLQQLTSELSTINRVEAANGGKIYGLVYNEKDTLHSDGTKEISTEKEGVKAHDEMDKVRDIPQSLIVGADGPQRSLPEIESGELMGNEQLRGLECKEEKQKQLSKSALKQLAKRERYKEVKLQRKAFEKEKRHQVTARKRKEWEEKLASLTEDEKEKTRLEKLSTRKERKDEQKSRKEKLRLALEKGQNLVIDLEFSQLMKPNEITSLIQQVMYSYAANGRAVVPARISLTGVRGDVQKELEKISGFSNWLVHKEEKSYEEVFKERQSDLVYLTADSENTLQSLDINKIYIIGGLVDRNRWKNVTLEKATKQQIATAKLPVGDHLKMLASQVLTVNQVMELLLCFLEVGDWKKSLMQIVPLRKRAAEEGLKASGGQQEL